MRKNPSIKLYEMLPGMLYQRGEFRHFPLDVKLAMIRARGIALIVNVSANLDRELFEALGSINTVKCSYLFQPFADSARGLDIQGEQCGKELTEAEKAARLAASFIERGKPVLIHCHAGRNRSSLVTALTLLQTVKDWTPQDAISFVRTIRPNALATQAFVDFIQQQGEPQNA